MVQWESIANRDGVFWDDSDYLLRGQATTHVGARLAVGSMSAADELVKMTGREGAIGFVIGLLISL